MMIYLTNWPLATIRARWDATLKPGWLKAVCILYMFGIIKQLSTASTVNCPQFLQADKEPRSP
jgi:hypothetical protein